MPKWPSTPFAMTLFTTDLAASKAFYTTFFNAEPVWGDDASSIFKAGDTMVNLLQIAAAPALTAPQDPSPAGIRAVYTLRVENVDTACAAHAANGLHPLNGPMDRPWGIRTASFQDPSGHLWELSHDLPR